MQIFDESNGILKRAHKVMHYLVRVCKSYSILCLAFRVAQKLWPKIKISFEVASTTR